MAYPIKKVKDVSRKARRHQVEPLGGGLYLVVSCESGEHYEVDVIRGACTCPRQEWITERNSMVNACSHVLAARIYHEKVVNARRITLRPVEEDVRRLHRRVIYYGDGVKFTARNIPGIKPASEMTDAEIECELFG